MSHWAWGGMPPQWAVGMTEQPDGSFRLSLLDDEPAISPKLGSAQKAEDAPAAAPAPEPSKRLVVLGAVSAFIVATILTHVSSLQHELMVLRRELKDDVGKGSSRTRRVDTVTRWCWEVDDSVARRGEVIRCDRLSMAHLELLEE